jgi:hypothetical protein
MFGDYKVGSLYVGFMGIPFFLFKGNGSGMMGDVTFLIMKRSGWLI